jgi:DNA-binding Xre family transcriptional regulator
MRKAGFWHTAGRFANSPNMTQLSERTSITYTTVNDLVNHNTGVAMISLDVLARLCAALQCTPSDILILEKPNATPATPLESFFRANPDADPYAQPRDPTAPQQRDPAISRF